MPLIAAGGRVKRLKQDLADMKALSEKCPAIKFRTIDDGDAPEKYEVSFYLRTIIDEENGEPIYREADSPTIISIDLSKEVSGYPFGGIKAQCITMPQPYHPNWFESGRWGGTIRSYRIIEPLAMQIIHITKEIQFDLLTGIHCWSNCRAADWCLKNIEGSAYFPCDASIIPNYEEIYPSSTIFIKKG